jgi:hypothetical protein
VAAEAPFRPEGAEDPAVIGCCAKEPGMTACPVPAAFRRAGDSPATVVRFAADVCCALEAAWPAEAVFFPAADVPALVAEPALTLLPVLALLSVLALVPALADGPFFAGCLTVPCCPVLVVADGLAVADGSWAPLCEVPAWGVAVCEVPAWGVAVWGVPLSMKPWMPLAAGVPL